MATFIQRSSTRNFNSFGIMPVDNDWLIKKVRGSNKTFWTLLIKILDKQSCL